MFWKFYVFLRKKRRFFENFAVFGKVKKHWTKDMVNWKFCMAYEAFGVRGTNGHTLQIEILAEQLGMKPLGPDPCGNGFQFHMSCGAARVPQLSLLIPPEPTASRYRKSPLCHRVWRKLTAKKTVRLLEALAGREDPELLRISEVSQMKLSQLPCSCYLFYSIYSVQNFENIRSSTATFRYHKKSILLKF